MAAGRESDMAISRRHMLVGAVAVLTISDTRDAMERLVHHLMREERAQPRRAAQSLRGGH